MVICRCAVDRSHARGGGARGGAAGCVGDERISRGDQQRAASSTARLPPTDPRARRQTATLAARMNQRHFTPLMLRLMQLMLN